MKKINYIPGKISTAADVYMQSEDQSDPVDHVDCLFSLRDFSIVTFCKRHVQVFVMWLSAQYSEPKMGSQVCLLQELQYTKISEKDLEDLSQ